MAKKEDEKEKKVVDPEIADVVNDPAKASRFKKLFQHFLGEEEAEREAKRQQDEEAGRSWLDKTLFGK